MRIGTSNVVMARFIGIVLMGPTCFFRTSAQPLLHSVQAHHAVASSLGTIDKHPFSVAVNPAAIARFRNTAWAFGGEQRFLAPGWSTWAAGGILPVASGSWSFLVAQEGLPALTDQLLMVTHAKRVSGQASVGLSLGVNRKKAGANASILVPMAAAGISFSVSEQLYTGFSYTRLMWQGADRYRPGDLSVLRCMLGYQPTDKFVWVFGVTKESGRGAMGSSAICYQPSRKAKFWIGYLGSPALCWFGLMLGIGKNVGVQVHSGIYSLIGVSNGMSVYSIPVEKIADQQVR